ncbi:MAG TPA: MlaA family lipoprotein, partial [Stellaceae bacterium]|nr:MlaA family lipoprotein [Stellaceae bacterium]
MTSPSTLCRRYGHKWALLATMSLSLAACATPPTEPAARAEFERTNDPWEPFNREVFDVNLFIDRVALKPIAQAYVKVVPEPGRN